VNVADHCATPIQEEYLSVSESQRLALHRAARTALGEEEGDALMELTPPANTDIATKQHIELAVASLRGDLLAEIERTASRTLRWSVGAMIVLHGGTVGLLTLALG
jgi:hypothetical protein